MVWAPQLVAGFEPAISGSQRSALARLIYTPSSNVRTDEVAKLLALRHLLEDPFAAGSMADECADVAAFHGAREVVPRHGLRMDLAAVSAGSLRLHGSIPGEVRDHSLASQRQAM